MRILHIVPSYKPAYKYGGTIESVARLCEELVRAGEEVTVFTTTANGKKELEVAPGVEHTVDGVEVVYFKRQTKDHTHASVALWKRLHKECGNYDVVHIHSWWNALVLGALFICKRKKVKTVFSPHGMLSDYIIQHSNTRIKYIIRSLAGKYLLKSTLLHATSTAELAECRKLIPGWQGAAVPNIIWLPELPIQKKQNEIFTLLFLSRIHPKKGLEFLMEAVSKINAAIRLQIGGTGEEDYLETLKQKAEELGITNRIGWLGWKDREEKFEVLAQADLFVLTSHNENFANVVVESLHAGTPVLLSAEIGLSPFVVQENLGWISTLQPADIRQKLEEAMADTGKRERIKQCAPLIIKKYFSPGTLIPQYLQLYQSLV